MQRRKPASVNPQWRIPEALQVHAELAAMATVAALPLLLLAYLLPRPLVLPVLCLIAFAAAGVVSLVAWRRAVCNPQRVNAWDVAGALAFIGCAAAIMSNPENVIYLADSTTTLRVRE